MTKKNTFSVARTCETKTKRLHKSSPAVCLTRRERDLKSKWNLLTLCFLSADNCGDDGSMLRDLSGRSLKLCGIDWWEGFCGKCNFRSVHLQNYLHSMARWWSLGRKLLPNESAEITPTVAISGDLRQCKESPSPWHIKRISRSIIDDMTEAAGSPGARGSFALSRTSSRHVNCRTWCSP